MKPAIDSSQDDETASKERFNLVGLDDSFPDKPQGHMMQMCSCANYKLLNDLQYLCQIVKASSVKSAVCLRVIPKCGLAKTVLDLKHFLLRHIGQMAFTV